MPETAERGLMPGGRPTEYRVEYAKEAKKLCMLGATDKELADFFEVTEQTINNWKQSQPKFFESIKAGKVKADANVAARLYCRAIGYQHDAVKILTVARGGNAGSDVVQEPYIEHYPPDTAAAIFWLKNRQPDKWREKQTVEVTDALTPAEREARVLELLTIAKQRQASG
ncbi:MAG: helix-turn-helix domain-containing protein [Methylocystis sp.]|uniref:helix-turn-helix domain-containing protein n=1 Tax=Methylocystis sp. TaxID=1911079 RepID=UPI003DA4D0A5